MATEYVILERRLSSTETTASSPSKPGEHGYAEVGNVVAASAAAAIRKHVEKTGEGGTFIAVPARSFTTLTLEVEQVAKVKVVGGAPAA